MPSQDLEDQSQTAYEILILSYLAEYSGAQDTLDGIIEWWLLERHVKYQIARVRDALRALVKDGLVLEHRMQNLPTRYGVNRDKVAEIRKILEEKSARPITATGA
ncbi:MAG TPA: hypothetical protein VKF36_01140 [Syntrophorhabdales bacterium]|nr:hypothetical protein [Syntrophorhabdales bacterium]